MAQSMGNPAFEPQVAAIASIHDYITVLHELPVMIAIVNANAEFIYFNSTWLDFRGCKLEQELNGMWMESVFPDDRQRCTDEFISNFKNHKYFETEFRLANALGEYNWMLALCKPFHNNKKEFEGFICSIYNTHQIKSAEIKVKESNNLWKALVENTPDVVIRYDKNLKRVFVNSAMEREYERPILDMLGKTDFEAGMDAEPATNWTATLQTVFKTGREDNVYLTLNTPVGKKHFICRLVPERDANGDVNAVLSIARDITELYSTSDILKTQSRQLQDVQRLAKIGSWEWDFINDKLTCSDEMFRIIETEPIPELKYDLFRRTVHPADWAMVDRAVKGRLDDFTPFSLNYRLVGCKGAVRYVNSFVSFVTNENGVPYKMVGLTQDITEISIKEQKLIEQNWQLKESQELANMGSWDYDIVNDTISGSDQLMKIFNLPAENYTYKDIISHIHPEDIEMVMDVMRRSNETEEAIDYQHRNLLNTGEVRVLKCRVKTERDAKGNRIRRFGMVQDVTEQHESAEMLKEKNRQLAEAQHMARLGNWEWNIETDQGFWSDEVYSIFGMTAEMKNITFRGTMMQNTHPEDRELVRTIIEEVQTTEEPIDFYYRIIRPDGEERSLHSKVQAVRDHEGKAIRVRGTIQDLTEQKKTADRMKFTLDVLEQKTIDLEMFALSASHDLQEPLRKIIAFGDRLKKRSNVTMTEQEQRFLAIMQKSARQMSVLIDRMYEFTRIKLGESPKTPVNLNAVADEVLNEFKTKITELSAGIKMDNLPVVKADRQHMWQLFENLIGNSLKFASPDRPLQIEILCRKIHRQYEFIFNDNGIGFKQEYAEKIFKPLNRLNPTQDFEGVGLGLSVCKKIVHEHGGEIIATGNPGAGATFIVYLPAREEYVPNI